MAWGEGGEVGGWVEAGDGEPGGRASVVLKESWREKKCREITSNTEWQKGLGAIKHSGQGWFKVPEKHRMPVGLDLSIAQNWK